MEYLKRTGVRNLFSYRRAVPAELREYLQRREIKQSLKTADRPTAIIAAQLVNTKVEAEFSKARAVLGVDQSGRGGDSGAIKASAVQAFQTAQRLLAGFDISSRDAQDGLSMALIDRAEQGRADAFELVQIDVLAGKPPPIPTISDAFELYLEERKASSTQTSNKKVLSQLRRTQAALSAYLGADREITSVSRMDAKGFRSSIETTGVSVATVNKHIGTASTVFATAIREHELEKANPFLGLRLADSETAKTKRDPMSSGMLRAYLATAEGFSEDLRDATILMAYTGARTGEIAHLVEGDVFVAGNDTPYLHIRPNALRGVKTAASNRRIPLVGEALEIMRRRLSEGRGRGPKEPLFPSLGRERGPRDVSGAQAQMIEKTQVIRDAIRDADAKIVPYSVRHTMQDALRAVGAPEGVRGAILGHSSESAIQAAYGAGEDLRVMERHLAKALEHLGLS